MFSVTIRDDAAPAMSGIIRALVLGFADKAAVNKAVARSGSNLTKKHLYGLANTRHRAGVALNFYEDAADSVSTKDLGGGVEIRIDKAGMAQRFYGGTIKPVNYSHLWIPLPGTVAEGKAAGEFDDLTVIINRTSNKGVALKDGTAIFALVDEVTQSPDESVLPSADEYAEAGIEGMNAYLDSVMAKNIETRPFISKTVLGRDASGRYQRQRIR
jgi:hypothetical protein